MSVINNQPGGSTSYNNEGFESAPPGDVVTTQPSQGQGQGQGGFGFSGEQTDPRVLHLGFLRAMPEVFIQQKLSKAECLTGCEMSNKYLVKDANQQVRVKESVECTNKYGGSIEN